MIGLIKTFIGEYKAKLEGIEIELNWQNIDSERLTACQIEILKAKHSLVSEFLETLESAI